MKSAFLVRIKSLLFQTVLIITLLQAAFPLSAQRQIPPADTTWLPDSAGYIVRGGPRQPLYSGSDDYEDYNTRLIATLRASLPDSQIKDSLAENAAWQSFPKHWVVLCPTDTGYVEYDPCNGGPVSLVINGDELRFWNGLEPEAWILKNVTQDATGFVLEIYQPKYQSGTPETQRITFERLAKLEAAFLVKLSNNRDFVMIPVEDRYQFPYVNLECPKNRQLEILDY